MSKNIFTRFANLITCLTISVIHIFATKDAFGDEQTSSDITKMEMKSTLEMSAIEIERWKFHLTGTKCKRADTSPVSHSPLDEPQRGSSVRHGAGFHG